MNLRTISMERVKAAARIADVVGDYVELTRKGKDLQGLCPFHNDHNLGNFVVSPSKNICSCFACEKTYDPVGFVMAKADVGYLKAIRILARKYGIPLNGDDDDEPLPVARKKERLPVELVQLPREWPTKANCYQPERMRYNPFKEWLFRLPWTMEEKLSLIFWLSPRGYNVGTGIGDNAGWTVFWQIDECGRVLYGKLMKYGEDGHRDKTAKYNFDTAAARLRRRSEQGKQRGLPADPQVEGKVDGHCLFGMHLFPEFCEHGGTQVRVVESEKSAIIAQTYYTHHPEILFMATGGAGCLKDDVLKPLLHTGTEIVLCPDADKEGEWRHFAETRDYPLSMCTNWIDREKDGEKADIADVILRLMAEREVSTRPEREREEREWREALEAKALELGLDRESIDWGLIG